MGKTRALSQRLEDGRSGRVVFLFPLERSLSRRGRLGGLVVIPLVLLVLFAVAFFYPVQHFKVTP